jgi:integrase
LVAYDSLQRRSELTALSASDLELNPDGTITLLQRRSKTDQQGSGRWIHLGFEASEALSDWLKAAGISDGFVFRAIGPRSDVLSDLSSGQIGRIFKSLAQRAGLGSDVVGAISGHSLRVGAAQDLLMKGASLPQIMVKGGWGKTDTVMRYVERVRPSSHL